VNKIKSNGLTIDSSSFSNIGNMNRDHKKYVRNTSSIFLCVHLRLYLIALQTDKVTRVGWDALSALSSEISEEDIEYRNNLKPTNNHVSGEDQF
jgi:hypothetical protein